MIATSVHQFYDMALLEIYEISKDAAEIPRIRKATFYLHEKYQIAIRRNVFRNKNCETLFKFIDSISENIIFHFLTPTSLYMIG